MTGLMASLRSHLSQGYIHWGSERRRSPSPGLPRLLHSAGRGAQRRSGDKVHQGLLYRILADRNAARADAKNFASKLRPVAIRPLVRLDARVRLKRTSFGGKLSFWLPLAHSLRDRRGAKEFSDRQSKHAGAPINKHAPLMTVRPVF